MKFDFHNQLSNFFVGYLTNEIGASLNTINSYKIAFVHLVQFTEQKKEIKCSNMNINLFTKDFILAYLRWLELEKKNTAATRNARLAAIKSFINYLKPKFISQLFDFEQILSIKHKNAASLNFTHLSKEAIQLILLQPDTKSKQGRRHLTVLSLIYDTGARVQEIIDLTPSKLHIVEHRAIELHGKGNKSRYVPMMKDQTALLKKYIEENKLNTSEKVHSPLFYNAWGHKLTRTGMNYIVKKYSKMARSKSPSIIPDKMSCHVFRHSKAMHLLQDGVNLIYIRDILGHSSISTTQIYARSDSSFKRAALEKVYKNLSPSSPKNWKKDKSTIEFIRSL